MNKMQKTENLFTFTKQIVTKKQEVNCYQKTGGKYSRAA